MFTPLNGRFADGVFHLLPDDIELPFELPFIEHITGDKHLPHKRLGVARHDANRIALDRHIAPAKQPSALLADDSAKECFTLLPRIGLGGRNIFPTPYSPAFGS